MPGYFGAPQGYLDPHLFSKTGRMTSVARARMLGPLYRYLDTIGLRESLRWLKAWAAGSGVSYQWGNGDLDVLLGVDRPKFDKANPGFAGIGEADLVAEINSSLREGLWPRTASTDINGATYEITYYYNLGTGTDIREHIHPYAAYDIVRDIWAVKPDPEPNYTFPAEYLELAERDKTVAADLVSGYAKAARRLQGADPRSADYHNAGAEANRLTAEASALLDAIHSGRRNAFQGGGQGYRDISNFRWQAAKQAGVIKALSGLSAARKREQEAEETRLYGEPLKSADELIRRAELYRRNG